jgi:hypothetical protein
MPNVITEKNDDMKLVRVRYTPRASFYENTPLRVSCIDGDTGMGATIDLLPDKWMKVPKCVAKQARAMENKSRSRNRKMVPDGASLDTQMENAQSRDGEGPINYNLRMEQPSGKPDYVIDIDGNI